MVEIDYSKIGLKCGIEIHQQLASENKLFCKCKARFSESKPIGEIIRKLRIVAGETGEIDIAALGEVTKGLEFVYKIYPEESCLVELDEEPPHPLNEEALDIGLTIALLLNCEIPNEIHVMRKIVLDGSNTSGFQRTAIIGLDGKIKMKSGDIGIKTVCLEEESCQIIERQGNRIVYGLDRLGIPLIEIGTSPEIHSPEQAKEVAEKLGMLVRSTEKVRRGIGTIRQDINVSIEGGARVEIKGAQELKMIPKLVENEVLRQKSLIEIKNDLEKIGFKSIEAKLIDATHIFKNSSCKITKDKETYAIVIPKLSGFFKRQLTPTRTLGNEIANYVRVRSDLKGIIHSDEDLNKYQLSKEFDTLRREVGAKENDLIVIATGEKVLVEKAMKVVVERVNQLLLGVPKEVRRALDNGDTEYMRPLPGSARLYPETDVPPIKITHEKLNKIKKNLPELLEEKHERLKKEVVSKFKLSEELTQQLIKSGRKQLFDKLVELGANPNIVASTLTSTLISLKRSNVPIEKLEEKHFISVFEKLGKNELAKEAIPDILKIFANEPNITIEEAIRKSKITALTMDDLRAIIQKTLKENSELIGDERGEKVLFGLVMQVVRGKINPQIVMDEFERELKKVKEN